MKKRLLPLSAAALLFAGACSSDKEEDKTHRSDSQPPVKEEVGDSSASDSIPTLANIPFQVKKYGEKKGDNVLDMEYPVSGNPELLDSVRTWMNEQLTDTYRGNLADAEAFFRHYVAQMGEDPELYDEGVYTHDDFRVGYVNDCIVTYDYTSFVSEGGAHDDGATYGITFLQSDGSVFNRDCITSYKALHPFIIEGLKKYFGVSTDEELKQQLITSSPLERLSPPGRNPWLDENGVVFSYIPYEIAPFSAGSPSFTIPYEDIEPYLTPHGKRFIQGKERIDNFRELPDENINNNELEKDTLNRSSRNTVCVSRRQSAGSGSPQI